MNRPVGFGVDGPLKRSYSEDFWCFAVSLRTSLPLRITSGHVMVGRESREDGSTAR